MGKRNRAGFDKAVGRSRPVLGAADFSPPGAPEWILLIAVFGLALLLRYPVADIPLERDEGEYAYIAARWLLGEIPYKDSFDQKPPGIFLVYALILRLIGTDPAAIHWGAQIYTLGTIGLLFLMGRSLFSAQAGMAAAAFCALMSVDHSMLGNAANTEIFMMLPLVGAFLAAVVAVRRESVFWAFAAGILAGAALMFKQVAVPDVIFYFLFVAWASKRRWLLTGAQSLGTVTVLFGVLAYFLSVGAWQEFYDCTISHNLSYSSRLGLSAYPWTFWSNFSRILKSLWPIYSLAFLGFLGSFGTNFPEGTHSARVARNARLVAAWLLVSFLGVATGGYFREHYFIQIVPAVALLAGLGTTQIPMLSRHSVSGTACLVACVAICYGVLVAPWYYLSGSPEEKCRRLYGYNPFPESVAVGRFISQHSGPQDTVFIFGSEPQILYYSGRRSASRYVFVYPLMTPFADTRQRQRQVLGELEKNRPKFVVTVFIPASFAASRQAPSDLSDGLLELLYRQYRVVGAVPIEEGKSAELVVGDAAAEMWQAYPIWYNRRIWGSLALWERSG